MIASYMNEITALVGQRKVDLRVPQLTLDNFYYREGDFREGSMLSGRPRP